MHQFLAANEPPPTSIQLFVVPNARNPKLFGVRARPIVLEYDMAGADIIINFRRVEFDLSYIRVMKLNMLSKCHHTNGSHAIIVGEMVEFSVSEGHFKTK